MFATSIKNSQTVTEPPILIANTQVSCYYRLFEPLKSTCLYFYAPTAGLTQEYNRYVASLRNGVECPRCAR